MAEDKKRQKRLAEERKNNKKARKLSGEIIADLPKRIKKAAERGGNFLDVYLPSDQQLHDGVKNIISSWCWGKNMMVATKNVRWPNDHGYIEVLVISWPKKK